MIVLTTATTAQTFNVIPRIYASEFSMSITDDSTNIPVYYDITNATTNVNFLTFTQVFNPVLVEGHFYDLTIYSDALKTNVIYKDRIFCTAQKAEIDADNNYFYKVNKDQYTEYDGFNNDYIVI